MPCVTLLRSPETPPLHRANSLPCMRRTRPAEACHRGPRLHPAVLFLFIVSTARCLGAVGLETDPPRRSADPAPPSVQELREAGFDAETLRPLLLRWLDAYPESAAEWSKDDLQYLLALLVGVELGNHPQAVRAAEATTLRRLEESPPQLAASAESISLTIRLLLRQGQNAAGSRWAGLGRQLCDPLDNPDRSTREEEAYACAFLHRDAAILEMRAGDYGRADQDLARARSWLTAFPNSEALVPVLFSSADLSCWRGEIDRCLELYRQGTDVAIIKDGSDSEVAAYGYLGLGWAAALGGAWGEARSAFERAQGIWEQQLGADHPRLADVLMEYGELLRRSGATAEAIQVLQRAVQLRELRLGPTAFDLPRVLDSLGLAFLDRDDFASAQTVLERAQRIREQTLEAKHPAHTLSWGALARVSLARGEIEKAVDLTERSLQLQTASFGPDHPVTAETALRLAEYLATSDPLRARRLAQRGRTSLTTSYGENHPQVGHAWEVEARTLRADGASPLGSALEAERIGREHVRRITRGFSEDDLLDYLEMRPRGIDLAIEAVLAREATPPQVLAVWDSVSRSRGIVLDSLMGLEAPANATTSALARPLRRARQALAFLLVHRPDPVITPEEETLEYIERLAQARQRVEREERQLSLLATPEASPSLTLSEVLSHLPPGHSLVAYQLFARGETTRLAAFVGVGTSVEQAHVSLHDLGPWAPIADSLRATRAALLTESEPTYRRLATRTRRQVWDPLTPALGPQAVWIVPDGPLHLLSFAALPTGRTYLVESGPTVRYLSTERDLVPPLGPDPTRSIDDYVVIAGGPEFGPPETTANADSAPTDFASLPAARLEAWVVEKLWRQFRPGVRVLNLRGEAATEADWRREAAAASVLHLATHGFHVGAGARTPSTPSNGTRWRGVGGLASQPEAARHDFALSGFALAGANRRTPDPTAGGGDGIVTLGEISTLDLTRAELVVLSFCDSGFGTTLSGEGLFGFHRAFRRAGAAALVLSVAPLADRDALEFMTAFYEALLRGNRDVGAAIRDASADLLQRRRGNGRDTHPRHWGTLLASGRSYRASHPDRTP